jgi:hypothetical protein
MLIKYLVLVSVCGLILTGCFEEETKDINNAAKHIENAASELSEGLNSIDPIGLKKLLDENSKLRETLSYTNKLLTNYANDSASIVLKGQQLKFEIVHYSGSFRIDLWIDDPKNWIWKNRRINDLTQTLSLQTGHELVSSSLKNIPLNTKIKGFDGNTLIAMIDNYRGAVQVEFKKFLKNAYPLPVPDQRFVDLNQNFITLGTHNLYISITPLTESGQGRWSFRGRLLAELPNGKELILKEFDVDDNKFKGHLLNKPLPDIVVYLAVKKGG